MAKQQKSSSKEEKGSKGKYIREEKSSNIGQDSVKAWQPIVDRTTTPPKTGDNKENK